MSVTFITDRIWPTLTAAARQSRSPAVVAVAYFGQGAAKLLPLRPGSRLVVDASDGAVKRGQTCPADLKKLAGKGVRIYTVQNLHAKVFVFGTKAFVGSANVSHRSAATLVEAMLASTDCKAVVAARNFVRCLCVQELGPEAIKRLVKIYRPPRAPGGKPDQIRRLQLVQLTLGDPPEGSESAEEAGRQVAARRRKNPSGHTLEEFGWSGTCPLRRGDMVIQVLDEGHGQKMVSPPGTVVHTRTWRRGRRAMTFVYVEVPTRRRVVLERLAKRLGYNAGKRLSRGGRVQRDFAERLLAAWSQ